MRRTNRLGSNQHRVKPAFRSLPILITFWYVTGSLIALALFFRLQGLQDGLRLVKPALADPRPTSEEIVPSEPPLAPQPERERVIALIKRVWGADAKIGLAVARCESGYREAGPHVANNDHSVDQGVFSINSVHRMPDMENATANISYAYTMYLKQGLTPWDPSRKCWSKEVYGE